MWRRTVRGKSRTPRVQLTVHPTPDPPPRWESLLSGVPAAYAAAGRWAVAAPVEGTLGIASAAHPLAAAAGRDTLGRGGSAFDAAVAVAAALAVVEPGMSGIGGYGTILVYDAARREVRFLDACGRIPAALDARAFRPPAPRWRENRRGAPSVSTPGAVPAWEGLHRSGGRLPWDSLLEHAIALAEDGFLLSPLGAAALASAFPDFSGEARRIYGRGDAPLGPGDRLVQAALGGSLRRIADEGSAVLRSGALGQAIETMMAEAGGFLRQEDLNAAGAVWRRPIGIAYGRTAVLTASPPATSFTALVRLGVMQELRVGRFGHNSADHLHRFAEVTRRVEGLRLRHASDPEVRPPPLDRLLSPAFWRDEAQGIGPTHVPSDGRPEGGWEGAHTTHFVVADWWGNVVSATLTLGELFGSRILVPGTGVWLNNSLAYAAWEPAGNPLEPRPSGRKLSGDAPVIALREGRPVLAVGTPGGHTIDQTVPQMVMNVLEWGMDLPAALAAARIARLPEVGLVVEPGVPEEVRNELNRRGHPLVVPPWPMLGNGHALAIGYDGAKAPRRFAGAADPRGEGVALAV